MATEAFSHARWTRFRGAGHLGPGGAAPAIQPQFDAATQKFTWNTAGSIGGTWIAQVQAKDNPGGTAGSLTDIGSLTINLSSAPDMAAASDSGTSSTDNVTNDTTPTFSGSAGEHSQVTLKATSASGTVVLGTIADTGHTPTWSITPATPLADGTYNVFAEIVNAGVTTTTGSLAVKIDTAAPTISTSRTAPNTAGWNNTDVVASYTAQDTLGGLASPAAGSHTFAAEGSGQSHTFTVADLAGNTASATVSGVNIDRTAPTITAARRPGSEANGYGWNNAAVTVGFTVGDALSGADGSAPDQAVTTEGADQSVTGVIYDRAGNKAEVTLGGIYVDTTKPAAGITSGPPAVTNSQAAQFGVAGSDPLSGVDYQQYRLDGGGWTLASSTVDLSGLAEGSHTFSVRSVDKAGNVGDPVSYSWTVDRATVTSASNASGVYGGTATLKATLAWHGDGSALGGKTVVFKIGDVQVGTAVTDGAGLAVLSNVSLAAVEPGYHTVTASFAGDAGYTASAATATLTVALEVKSLSDLGKAFKAGRTIPIKLQLTDANGVNLSDPSVAVKAIKLVKSDGTEVSLQDAGGANPGNLFRYDAALGGYIFNLSTQGLSAGTYTLTIAWTFNGVETKHELGFTLV